MKLLAPIRPGRQAVNIVILVEYQEGGDALVDECYTLEGNEPLFGAAEALREAAKALDEAWA